MTKTKIKYHQQIPTNKLERESLQSKGQFWTPSWVAEAMVAYVAQGASLIFDPAVGQGAFLEALAKISDDIDFYGTDIDPKVLSNSIYSRYNSKIELRDFILSPPTRKFPSIVANPPYIRHHKIDEKTKEVLKKMSYKVLGHSIDGRAGLHIYFLIQALSLLEENGKLAFIMPADTCEGIFAAKLWKWISTNFCIKCVVTFTENATPFPGVDTNAIIFMIENVKPENKFFWVKSLKPYSHDLFKFVLSEFRETELPDIDISVRDLQEAIATGLSRPASEISKNKFILNDFAFVMRGIASGSNDYFFLTEDKIKELKIPLSFFKRAVGRTRDIKNDIFTSKDLENIEKENRPTYLLAIDKNDELPKTLITYLEYGEEIGLPNQALIKQRKPWYKMEKREIPPLLFAYLGRRSVRFIKNEANILPLTGFLCVYSKLNEPDYIHDLWQALNHPDTLQNLHLVGKSYGSGAIKVEPKYLGLLPIPEHIVHEFNLSRAISAVKQLAMF